MPRCSIFTQLLCVFAASLAAVGADFPGVRENWKVELVLEAPRLKHPSVVACAPDGKVFVAEDPMDITRPAHVAEGRILCLHPDGRLTVFAEKLHAVFGMQYVGGKLYVLHNPKFSVFRDDQGVGKDRKDIIEQTNPNPWALDWNDHVPANFRQGMDGRFYVAVGDKGIFGAVGTDGKRVDLHGGGILRLRPDGSELEVYSTGVRNILDVGMTDEDEIFTYDNTDENHWMGRVTHMVDGGFYGYPFDFIPQRPYTLWMMADYGAGAATGVECYTGDVLPPEYRNNLFLADFGQRNVRRVVIERSGATFKAVKDEQLFVNPPGDFRPVGIAFSSDGRSLYICDWQHRDTKEEAVAGRLWKLTWIGKNHGAQSEMEQRRKLRAVWAPEASQLKLMEWARGGDFAVARQAIRRLGDEKVASALPILTNQLHHQDASIRFKAATALGRIGEWEAAEALVAAAKDEDMFVRYAAFTALNRIGRGSPDAWPAVIRGLKDQNQRVREACGFAMRETYDKELARMLASALKYSTDPDFKIEALRVMAPLHHKPPVWNGEWWAYHPFRAAPPSKTNAWEGTELIYAALAESLIDAHPGVRRAAVDGLAMFGTEAAGDLLYSRLEPESDPSVIEQIWKALAGLKYAKAGAYVVAWIRGGDFNASVLALARASKSPAVLDALKDAVKNDVSGAERAVELLAEFDPKGDWIRDAAARGKIPKRMAAIKAMGNVDELLKLKNDADVRDAVEDALMALPDVRALEIYLRRLGAKNASHRSASVRALKKVRAEAWPTIAPKVASLSKEVVAELQQIYRGFPGTEALMKIEVDRPAREAYLAHVLENAGDAERGEKIFKDRAGAACINCHRVKGDGVDVGPDLSGAGAQFDRRALAESVLWPNRAVREGYNVVELELKDGEELGGMIRAETAESLVVQPASGAPVTIPKQKIRARKPTAASLMPEGLETGLSLEDFSDLLSYLQSLRSGT